MQNILLEASEIHIIQFQHSQVLLFLSLQSFLNTQQLAWRKDACRLGNDCRTGTACVICNCDSKPTWSAAELGPRAGRRTQPDHLIAQPERPLTHWHYGDKQRGCMTAGRADLHGSLEFDYMLL